MRIIISFDYELFFGKRSGNFRYCILEPAKMLLKVAKKYGINYTIFVDAGYLLKLKEYKKIQICQKEYELNLSLLEQMVKDGHNIQIHMHPHWMNTNFNIHGWNFDLSKYSIHDFSSRQKAEIFRSYTKTINEIIGEKASVIRFGGWCIQPYEDLACLMKENDLKVDSTVFVGGFDRTSTHYYDFTLAPRKTYWNFNNDPVQEEKNGIFTEIPISSIRLLPSFYLKYLLIKALRIKKHKDIGDGIPLWKSKKKRIELLTIGGISVVSTDGYKASNLTKSFMKYNHIYDENDFFVTIGHLKSCTKFSINTLEKFIKDNMKNHEFTTYTSHTKQIIN